jgi:hypothetical protein
MENKTDSHGTKTHGTDMGLSPSMGLSGTAELSEIAAQLGKRGGDKNAANHNHEWFVRQGQLGMAKRWAGHKKTI